MSGQMSCTPLHWSMPAQLFLDVCLQALCNVSKLPQNLRQQLFRPQPPQGATAQLSLDK